jgi:hypothetical protein
MWHGSQLDNYNDFASSAAADGAAVTLALPLTQLPEPVATDDSYVTAAGTPPEVDASATDGVLASTAPEANSDSYTGTHRTTLSVSAIDGVLANDGDAEGDLLTATLVSGPLSREGALTLHSDGSFEFTPTRHFRGTTSFQYLASDGENSSQVAEVAVTIGGGRGWRTSLTSDRGTGNSDDGGADTTPGFDGGHGHGGGRGWNFRSSNLGDSNATDGLSGIADAANAIPAGNDWATRRTDPSVELSLAAAWHGHSGSSGVDDSDVQPAVDPGDTVELIGLHHHHWAFHDDFGLT